MKTISVNKKARFKYQLLDRFEAGLELKGTEVKSLREGHVSIAESFGRMRGEEAFLINMDIPPYEAGSIHNHERKRARKLLLHRRELKKLTGAVSQKGFTLVPVKLYFKRGWAKVELAVARGKTQYDKRETIKGREARKEIQRAKRRR
jgi:SsrA-binding protein